MHTAIRPGILLATLVLAATGAQAHEAAGAASGFVAGLLHPLQGLDHVVAMVAVGLWGAFLGAPALWLLPIVFPLVMAVGGAIGVLGYPLPAVETGIAASAVLLGAMVLLRARPPLLVAGALVALFAIFHGHAHGTELPFAADPAAYALGFMLATGTLHLLGIGFGWLARWPAGTVAIRSLGGAIALTGVGFLAGVL